MKLKPIVLPGGLEISADDCVPAWVRWTFEPSGLGATRPSELFVDGQGKDWPFVLESFQFVQMEGMFRWNIAPEVDHRWTVEMPLSRCGDHCRLLLPVAVARCEQFEAVELYLFEPNARRISIYGCGWMQARVP